MPSRAGTSTGKHRRQIGYRTRGRVPIRSGANAWLPVPGWDGAHEWTGMIPFEEMPVLRDPAAGWIATANSRIVEDGSPADLVAGGEGRFSDLHRAWIDSLA